MATFDVRSMGNETIDKIAFGNVSSSDYYADAIIRHPSGGFRIKESDTDDYVVIKDREHFDNLLNALNKAKELGWI